MKRTMDRREWRGKEGRKEQGGKTFLVTNIVLSATAYNILRETHFLFLSSKGGMLAP